MNIDLNSDLGESLGVWRMGDDAAMLDIVSSANVACGFHAGDAAGILDTLRHFVRHCDVDGFRFDLAPVLGRGPHGFGAHALSLTMTT
eukprot:gene16757-22215_t